MNALELRQERMTISKDMERALEKSDLAKFKELRDKSDNLKERIDAAESLSTLNTELNMVRNAERPPINDGYMPKRSLSHSESVRSTQEYADEFRNWLRTGTLGERMWALNVEHRDLTTVGATAGETLVPTGFEAELAIVLKAWGGMRRLCRILKTTTGNPMPWPRMSDITNVGEFLTEGSPTNAADPTFDNVTFGSSLVSSKLVKVSVQLEQDSAFDMAGLLSNAFGIRLGRITNKAYTVGDGSATYGGITGLVNALVTATGRSVLATGAHANTNSAGDTDLNSLGTSDLVAAIQAVDPAYRQNPSRCAFAGNQATWDHLRSLRDQYGRLLWQVSLAANVPDSILGYAYDFNQDLETLGAGNISVVFGNWDHAVIRDVLAFTLCRFNELYMGSYERGYQAFMRTDFHLLDANAFAYIIHPQS